MAATDPFSAGLSRVLTFSRPTTGAFRSPQLNESECKLLLESLETNTLVLEDKNHRVVWNLGDVSKADFVNALKENRILKMGEIKGNTGGSRSISTHSESHTTTVNGKIVAHTSSTQSKEVVTPSKSPHIMYFCPLSAIGSGIKNKPKLEILDVIESSVSASVTSPALT